MNGSTFVKILCVVVMLALQAGCNFPVAEPSPQGPDLMYTLAAQTLQARREIAVGTPRPTLTYAGPLSTPSPVISLPGGTPENATPTSHPPDGAPLPCDRAHFVADVTIPDDTPVQAGMIFIKTWRIVNGGSCTWVPGYALVFANGYSFGAPAATALSGEVPPGGEVEISLHLTAPTKPGAYQGDWKLRSASGVYFGFGADGSETIWVRVQVVE